MLNVVTSVVQIQPTSHCILLRIERIQSFLLLRCALQIVRGGGGAVFYYNNWKIISVSQSVRVCVVARPVRVPGSGEAPRSATSAWVCRQSVSPSSQRGESVV